VPRILALAFLLLVTVVRAHQIAEMTLRIDAKGDSFRAILQADAAYMLPEYRGDDDVAAQDLAWLRQQSRGEWQRIREETERFLRQCLSIRSGAAEIDWQLSFPDFEEDVPRFMDEGIAEMPPMIAVEIDGSFSGPTLSIRWEEPFGVVLIVQTGEETIPVISGYEESVLQRGENNETTPVVTSLTSWIRLGFRHIVPEGLDHVLFMIGIFLLLPRWKPLLAQSLLFTLAHSITLGLAVIGWVRLPEFWVELAIAASIAWIGFENLWIKQAGRGRYALITVFGLIHGLGFALMLMPLLPANRPDAMVSALAGFNIGVEFGQLLVIGVAFAIFRWWKEKEFSKVRTVGSILIGIAGLSMFLSRAIGGFHS
jgi:hypothetical protein